MIKNLLKHLRRTFSDISYIGDVRQILQLERFNQTGKDPEYDTDLVNLLLRVNVRNHAEIYKLRAVNHDEKPLLELLSAINTLKIWANNPATPRTAEEEQEIEKAVTWLQRQAARVEAARRMSTT